MTYMVDKNNGIIFLDKIEKKGTLRKFVKHKVQVFVNTYRDILLLSKHAQENYWDIPVGPEKTNIAQDNESVIISALLKRMDINIQEVIGLESDLVRTRGEMTFAQNKLDKQEAEQRKEVLELKSEINRMKTIMQYCYSEIEKGADKELILAILKQARDEYD